MKISELKQKRIIHRPTRNFDEFGKRIYNEFEYDFPYDISYKNSETERLLAKLIDMLPFFILFFFVFHQGVLMSILFSVPCVIILGTITEFYRGNTLGKWILGIKVLDDFGNYPVFLKSLSRNFLCLANFYPFFLNLFLLQMTILEVPLCA